MKEIERRLRDLGEQVREDDGRRSPLSAFALQRIKFRRIATVLTSAAVVVGLGIGATYATWDRSRAENNFEVSQPGETGFARYGVHFSPQQFVSLELSAQDGTVCYSIGALPRPGSIERVEIFHNDQQVGPGHVQGMVEIVPNAAHFSPAEGDNCVRSVDREAIAAVIRNPKSYSLLVDYGFGLPLTAGLTDRPPGGTCGQRVDFEPTYLPKGWVTSLQPGDGGGGGFQGVIGHFGNEAASGTAEKANDGFATLIAGKSPYSTGGEAEEIRVLNRPALFGAIHEGFSVEFSHRGCNYVLLGHIEGQDLRRFAEGLRVAGTREQVEPVDEHFAAIWPEDNRSDAMEACAEAVGGRAANSIRYDPESVAVAFGSQVLGWESASVSEVDTAAAYRFEGVVLELRRDPPDSAEDSPRAAAVVVWTVKIVTDCWSVQSVSRTPEEAERYQEYEGASLSVRGRDVSMYFADFKDAATAEVEVGYGGQSTRYVWRKGDDFAEWRLDFEPSSTGHFLVLLKDADGEIFSAFGSALPEGDFAAG